MSPRLQSRKAADINCVSPEPSNGFIHCMAPVNDPRINPHTPEYYRAQAEYCRQQAEQAQEEFGVRQRYLDLAAKWEGWARQIETN